MNHHDRPFILPWINRFWNARRSSKTGRHGSERFPYPIANIRRDFRHSMHQNHRDLRRRGRSNREGSNNRRFRKWKAKQPRIILTTPLFSITA